MDVCVIHGYDRYMVGCICMRVFSMDRVSTM